MIDYESRLTEILNSVHGTVLVSLVGTDGMGLANSVKDDSIDIEKMDADITSIVINSQKIAKDREKGSLMELFFTTGHSTYIILPINDLYFIYLLVEGEKQNLGLARHELHSSLKDFEESLKY